MTKENVGSTNSSNKAKHGKTLKLKNQFLSLLNLPPDPYLCGSFSSLNKDYIFTNSSRVYIFTTAPRSCDYLKKLIYVINARIKRTREIMINNGCRCDDHSIRNTILCKECNRSHYRFDKLFPNGSTSLEALCKKYELFMGSVVWADDNFVFTRFNI